MSDDVRDVKDRINIAELIGDHVELRRRGSSYWGLCPFHTEKTPSFCVQPERGTFHCFGCGKGGDIFTFVMEMEGVGFPEALRMLADRAGVTLSSRAPRAEARARDARSVLEEANAFYRARLAATGGEAARAYLSRRALDADACAIFELGWAPASWDALMRHLASIGIPTSEAENAGVVSAGERGSYDRFRARVIFPVRDETSKLCGFGGRLIDGDGPKYINSVNSREGGDKLFDKSRLLYLMHLAKRAIGRKRRAILTEGYMDAIRCHLCGFDEAVASLGTSLTERQAALIKRFTDLCYIVYDGDGAGQAASIRGMYILKEAGVDVRVAMLPDGRDPDEVLSAEGGAEIFERALASALPLPLHHVRARAADLRSPEMRHIARDEVLSSIARLPMLYLAEYVPQLARSFGLLQHEFERELAARRRREPGPRYEVAPQQPVRAEPQSRELDLECAMASMLWQHEGLRAELAASDVLPYLSDEAVCGIVSALLSGESPDELETRWRAMGERACLDRLARGDAVAASSGLAPVHARKIADSLRDRALRRRCEALKPVVLSEGATEAEIDEYMELVKRLKGRG